MKYINLKKIYSILFLFIVVGCSKAPIEPKTISLTEAQEKFIAILEEESKLEVEVFALPNTIWIYLPVEYDILDFKAKADGPIASSERTEKYAINFLDGEYDNGTYHLSYDIDISKNYAKSYGYDTSYGQKYQDDQRAILTALSRAYADVERDPGDENQLVHRVSGDIDFENPKKQATHKKLVHDYVPTERVQDFAVIVIANVKRGIETRMTIHLGDLLRAMQDNTFHE